MNASVIKTHLATATDGEQEGAEGGGVRTLSKCECSQDGRSKSDKVRVETMRDDRGSTVASLGGRIRATC